MEEQYLMPAAALILLYPKNGEYCILLNKRSQQVEHHKGEVSFPGGGRDPEDADFQETALREAQEEMGVRPQDVTVLGQLDDVVTRSNFGVKVFVGTIPYPYPSLPARGRSPRSWRSLLVGFLTPGTAGKRPVVGRPGQQILQLYI